MREIDEFIDTLQTTVHWTASNWPMVGFRELSKDGHQWRDVLEPWQARELGNKLQTIAEQLIRNAAAVERHRAGVMDDPRFGGVPPAPTSDAPADVDAWADRVTAARLSLKLTAPAPLVSWKAGRK